MPTPDSKIGPKPWVGIRSYWCDVAFVVIAAFSILTAPRWFPDLARDKPLGFLLYVGAIALLGFCAWFFRGREGKVREWEKARDEASAEQRHAAGLAFIEKKHCEVMLDLENKHNIANALMQTNHQKVIDGQTQAYDLQLQIYKAISNAETIGSKDVANELKGLSSDLNNNYITTTTTMAPPNFKVFESTGSFLSNVEQNPPTTREQEAKVVEEIQGLRLEIRGTAVASQAIAKTVAAGVVFGPVPTTTEPPEHKTPKG